MYRILMVKNRSARRLGDGRSTNALAALLAAVLLAGCGQKGPLWVPGHSKNTPWPMKPSAADSDSPTPAPAPGQSAPPAAPATPAIPATPDASPTQKGAP